MYQPYHYHDLHCHLCTIVEMLCIKLIYVVGPLGSAESRRNMLELCGTHCLREHNTLARTPSQTPSKILQPRVLKTPQPWETPIKPPRKHVADQKPSSKQPG